MNGVAEHLCSRHCGYYSHGEDLADHERYEHMPCTECGAGTDQDLSTYSLSHKSACTRLLAALDVEAGADVERLAAEKSVAS